MYMLGLYFRCHQGCPTGVAGWRASASSCSIVIVISAPAAEPGRGVGVAGASRRCVLVLRALPGATAPMVLLPDGLAIFHR